MEVIFLFSLSFSNAKAMEQITRKDFPMMILRILEIFNKG